ncbi:MAG: hypothetical protein H7281_12820 [Bacteriovorax sp.]|nr:hypothetical protein [Bacteriovorax sp.]
MTKKICSKFFVLLLVCLVSTLAIGDDKKKLDDYYGDVFLGERKTQNYYGPLDPRSTYSDTSGELILLDDTFKEHYINKQIQDEPFDLHHFWFNDLVDKSTCPNITLGENIDYIRYLYRLVSMSYLFEGLKLNNKLADELGVKNTCPITFKAVFESCKPESGDMKKFHERVYGKFVNEIDKIKHQTFSKKETASWLEEFQRSTSLTTEPTFSRLHDWCIANKKNCRNIGVNEIKEALNSFCTNDTQAIQTICSEKDSYYGLYSISTPTDLIKISNAFNLINQSGMGEDCLRRYGKIFHAKESSYGILSKQYPLLYSYLLKTNSRYPQGELFLPGALKEFDMKGLSDFLTALKPPKALPVIVVIKQKPKPKLKPVVVAAPRVIELKPEAPIVVVEPIKPHVSEFERALEELKGKSVSSASLDMDAFRDDFEFTSDMIAELSGPIKKFQTRAALNDMKSYDRLGTAEAPVGLVFLKFLIDTENHQGLYNIITVIGDKFYISNDIEKKTEPHYAQLKNDTTTKNRWTIILLRK